MEQKEIRLNAEKRKSLVIDFRKHCESLDTHEKEEFKQSRDDAKSTIESSFETCTNVVQRRFPLEDVATLQSLQKKHNTINAVGTDSCFFFKVTDAPKVLDRYNDEVDKSKHFSFELDGSIDGDYGSRYGSGSSNNGKNILIATLKLIYKLKVKVQIKDTHELLTLIYLNVEMIINIGYKVVKVVLIIFNRGKINTHCI